MLLESAGKPGAFKLPEVASEEDAGVAARASPDAPCSAAEGLTTVTGILQPGSHKKLNRHNCRNILMTVTHSGTHAMCGSNIVSLGQLVVTL